ncbi:MAG: metallophosphoesterase family protein [Phycisphaeraceae bacterium]
MRLALIGDIHLFSLRVKARQLLGKRLLGQGNLWLNRRFRFNHGLLEPLVERVAEIEPDMVLLTGDVSTTSLESEFKEVIDHLRPVSDHVPVVIVPGNHDRYTFRSARHKRIETVLEGLMPDKFPHDRHLTDRWRLLALDSARPQLMMSRGAIGPKQLMHLRKLAKGLGEEDGLIVLCHYPPDVPPGTPRSWAHDLADAKMIRRVLAESRGRVVYLHGHVHRPWHWEVEDDHHLGLTCINAGAPCLTSAQYPFGQGFWEIGLPADPREELKLVHHVPTPEGHYGTRAKKEHHQADARWHARRVL